MADPHLRYKPKLPKTFRYVDSKTEHLAPESEALGSVNAITESPSNGSEIVPAT
jgi:hypothetical protein